MTVVMFVPFVAVCKLLIDEMCMALPSPLERPILPNLQMASHRAILYVYPMVMFAPSVTFAR